MLVRKRRHNNVDNSYGINTKVKKKKTPNQRKYLFLYNYTRIFVKTPIIVLVTMILLVSMILSSPFLQTVSAARATTNYFSIEVPNNWTYVTDSIGGSSSLSGIKPDNAIVLVPTNFSDSLLQIDKSPAEAMAVMKVMNETLGKGGSFIIFLQDADYPLKNAPLSTYVNLRTKYLDIISKEDVTVGNEMTVKVTANGAGPFPDYGTIFYFFQHDNKVYDIAYSFDKNNKDKYLPQFEEMVKSLNFVNSNVIK